MKVNKSK